MNTALDLFLAQGYEATSLREIAERLEITKAALYYHFPAKEQLAVELSREFLNELADLVATARTDRRAGRNADRVELLAAYLGLFRRHQRVIDLLSRNPATADHPDVGQRARTLIEALIHEIAGRDAKAADRVRVACAIGAINTAATLTTLRPDEKSAGVILGAALAALDAEAIAVPTPSGGRRKGTRQQLKAI